jgi:hypothetical protein
MSQREIKSQSLMKIDEKKKKKINERIV